MKIIPGIGALLLLFVAVSSLLYAEQSAGPAGPPAHVDTGKNAPAPPDQRQLQRELEKLNNDVVRLSNKLTEVEKSTAYLTYWTNGILVLLAVILAIGTSASVVWGRSSEKRSMEAFGLMSKGEAAAQERDKDVHKLSQNTLQLVNETLTIAKDAMENSTKEVQNREQQALLDYETQATGLVKKRSDDKVFVERPKQRTEIHHLADQIIMLRERQKFSPTALRLKITSYCTFILGMHSHLEEEFETALKLWEDVAVDQQTDPELASLAWYWHGYLRNNLGSPKEAQLSFEKAYPLTMDTDRRYELERIMIETRFFDSSQDEEVDRIMKDLLALSDRLAKETSGGAKLRKRQSKIHILIGNINLVKGSALRLSSASTEAQSCYNLAAESFAKAEAEELWAQFGLAEANHWLDKTKDAEKGFAEVFNRVIDQYTQRQELRTKALLRSTQLICSVRVPGLKDQIPSIMNQVRDTIGALVEVDERLTVYSQKRKRNVRQSELVGDLQQVIQGKD